MATAYDAVDGANPGIVALEQEDVAHDVFVQNSSSIRAKSRTASRGSSFDGERPRSRSTKRAVALFEHGVVEGVLRVEVRVERRLAKADHRREVSKRDRAESVAVGERPGCREDLLALGLLAPRPGISLIYHR